MVGCPAAALPGNIVASLTPNAVPRCQAAIARKPSRPPAMFGCSINSRPKSSTPARWPSRKASISAGKSSSRPARKHVRTVRADHHLLLQLDAVRTADLADIAFDGYHHVFHEHSVVTPIP